MIGETELKSIIRKRPKPTEMANFRLKRSYIGTLLDLHTVLSQREHPQSQQPLTIRDEWQSRQK